MDIMQAIAQEVAKVMLTPQFKAGTASTTPSTPYYTGSQGLFSASGVGRQIISTIAQPTGLASRLPAVGNNVINPLFGFITGYSDITGSNKNGVCDDPPTAGALLACRQIATLGRYELQTRTLEVNRVGQRITNETTDFQLVNSPLITNDGGLFNSSMPAGGGLNLGREMAMRIDEVARGFNNILSRQIWDGNPANNTAQGGYAEFPGYGILVGTGKIDAITKATCGNLDSLVRSFGYQSVTSTAGMAGGGIVRTITAMLRYLKTVAEKTNLAPVQWALVMREGLFYEITAVWPCAYITDHCAQGGNVSQNVDARSQTEMRDAMRTGNYLLVDGIQYPVVFDDGLVEFSNATNSNVPNGSFASDIWFLPLTFAGGLLGTYLEYFDFSGGEAAAGVIADGNMGDDFWTDNGAWLWHKKTPVNWCVQLLAKIEPRLILRVPHLAARLRNIVYTPLIHTIDTFSDQPYFQRSGTAQMPVHTYYSEWGDVVV